MAAAGATVATREAANEAAQCGSSADPERHLWIHRTGAPWRDLPERYGPVGMVSSWFYRWRTGGIWQRVLSGLQAAADERG
jgi:transposase